MAHFVTGERARGAFFTTSLGDCAVTWTERGIRQLQLPAADRQDTLARLTQGNNGNLELCAPPAAVCHVCRRLAAHLTGQLDGLSDVALDLAGLSDFVRLVYTALREVRPGETTSYAELAADCRRPGAARAVGRAMATNRIPLLVPCHRVLTRDGALGNFSAPGGAAVKLRLLTIEDADRAPLIRGARRQLARQDSALAQLINRVGACALDTPSHQDHLTSLVQAMVHQQVSLAAGRQIYARLLQLVGDGERVSLHRLFHCPEHELRQVGLSRQKASYVLDLARRIGSGSLQLDDLRSLSDAQVIDALTTVRGIGRWTAEMFLIFQLRRLDVMPLDDVGLRRAVQQIYGLPQPPSTSWLDQLADTWRPFRSVACWYLWRAL